jgi:hypothetical protein
MLLRAAAGGTGAEVDEARYLESLTEGLLVAVLLRPDGWGDRLLTELLVLSAGREVDLAAAAAAAL